MEEAEKKLSLGFLLIHGNEHMKSYVCVCVCDYCNFILYVSSNVVRYFMPDFICT